MTLLPIGLNILQYSVAALRLTPLPLAFVQLFSCLEHLREVICQQHVAWSVLEKQYASSMYIQKVSTNGWKRLAND